MQEVHFDQTGRFVQHQFDRAKPFSSFLPGIAGVHGIPIWAFYVNRGQAIASFGVDNKDNAIMEFQPANKAYQYTCFTGFRTFIKLMHQKTPDIYEPFAPTSDDRTRMIIGMGELAIEAIHERFGLQTKVRYFGLPGEDFAALVREVQIANLGDVPLSIELLDGMAAVVPYGTTNQQLKHIGRTIEAWMEVLNVKQRIPFYRLRASAEDATEVSEISAGHFYLAFTDVDGQIQLLRPLVDPQVVFGQNSSFSSPDNFTSQTLSNLLASPQITMGRTPCGLFGTEMTLAPGESREVYALIGHARDLQHLHKRKDNIALPQYIQDKRSESRDLIDQVTQVIETHTNSRVFDTYCRQTFLDNVLRGGWPLILGDETKSAVYHVYSRKHGDLERDYNDYQVAAEMYSQGNGNYRDVNQNRRSDVMFNPAVEDFNLLAFLGLIQTDGYNPLVIKGTRFSVPPDNLPLLLDLMDKSNLATGLFTGSFTPGQLIKQILDHDVQLKLPLHAFLTKVITHSEQSFEATFGEGYWIDHWTYLLDLIDSYLSVYPDQRENLLFENENVTYFDSPAIVQPRELKYVLAEDRVRQYGSVDQDEEKASLIASRKHSPNLVRSKNGTGEVFHTTVFAKLFGLALLKFATLDPSGTGIEMEAGKPGWYDALNGLPGLFGSSLCETYELARLVKFLLEGCEAGSSRSVKLPIEQVSLLEDSFAALEIWKSSQSPGRDFVYWDTVASSREQYRSQTRFGFDGQHKTFRLDTISKHLTALKDKVHAGIQRAVQMNNGMSPTYFSYSAKDYEVLKDASGQLRVDDLGRPYVRVLTFEPSILPQFLEGYVHALKLQPDVESARVMYGQVRESGLYDRKLEMYKVNDSLEDQSFEIGRAKAFTPGWLENESIWLHMEYKYLLEVLRAGLCMEFFEDFENVLIPFQDPQRYGRSTLENSSFLVSSAHPDASLHGNGFVARLSGATAEFLSIWNGMMMGQRPFFIHNGQLHLEFRPVLPGWMFTDKGEISFRFLGTCKVTYHNPSRANTFEDSISVQRICVQLNEDHEHEIEGAIIPPPFAERVRKGEVEEINIYLD